MMSVREIEALLAGVPYERRECASGVAFLFEDPEDGPRMIFVKHQPPTTAEGGQP
jgi:hypothetical protein